MVFSYLTPYYLLILTRFDVIYSFTFFIGKMDPYVLIQYKGQEKRSGVANGTFYRNIQVYI